MKKNNMAKTLWILFSVVLLASLVADFFMHPHAKFSIEGTAFFNAWFGFLSCVIIVFVSKFLGIFLKRKEGYYREVRHDK